MYKFQSIKTYFHVEHLLNIEKEYKNLRKHEILDKCTEINGYNVYKDLIRRTASDKVLRDKAFEIGSNKNMMDSKADLL